MSDITLGKIITGDAKPKDAIHVAIARAMAADALSPGQRVTVVPNGCAYAVQSGGIGIVDPFLTTRVLAGQQFWILLDPGTVANLRHEWDHHSFPDPEPESLDRLDRDRDDDDDGCRGC